MDEGEVERIKWNPNDKHYFIAGTSDSKICYFDSRATEPLWMVQANEKEVTDFSFNTNAPSILISSSADNFVKVWKFDSSACSPVYVHQYKLGQLHCLHEAPENNWIVGLGGR